MKKINVKLRLPLLLCLIGILALVYMNYFLKINILGSIEVVTILIILLLTTMIQYYVKSKRSFKYRFLIQASGFGAMMAGFSVFSRADNLDELEFEPLRMLIMFLGMSVIQAGISYLFYRSVIKSAMLKLDDGEEMIINDTNVYFEDEDDCRRGALFLTNKRLSFIATDNPKFSYELSLNDVSSNIEIVSSKWYPLRGIKLIDNNVEYRMIYPLCWRNEISKLAALKNDSL